MINIKRKRQSSPSYILYFHHFLVIITNNINTTFISIIDPQSAISIDIIRHFEHSPVDDNSVPLAVRFSLSLPSLLLFF